MPCNASYARLFLESFSQVLSFDMHFYMHFNLHKKNLFLQKVGVTREDWAIVRANSHDRLVLPTGALIGNKDLWEELSWR
jgi:hypothetical protein